LRYQGFIKKKVSVRQHSCEIELGPTRRFEIKKKPLLGFISTALDEISFCFLLKHTQTQSFSGGKSKRQLFVALFASFKIFSSVLKWCFVCECVCFEEVVTKSEFLSFDFAIGWDVQREHADSTGRAM
jgi:hypothetical protein